MIKETLKNEKGHPSIKKKKSDLEFTGWTFLSLFLSLERSREDP